MGNATTSSRTGLLQLLLLGVFVGVWNRSEQNAPKPTPVRLPVQLILVALLSYGLASFAFPWLVGMDAVSHNSVGRLVQGDRLCASRITLWNNVLYLITHKPWLGWGWGELSYAHYITLYPVTRFCEILDNAHNLPLQLAVELGVPAAVLLCGGAFVLTVRARPWRERDPLNRVAWAVLGVILLHSMLEYPLWYGPFLLAAILCITVLWRSPSVRRLATPTKSLPAIATMAMGLAALTLLAFVSYAAWDYHRVSQIFMRPSERTSAYRDDTLAKLRGSWLFRKQVGYAELTTTPVTASNVTEKHALALELLHFSPEPRVIEKLIESSGQLGLDDEVQAHTQRFKAAFPDEYLQWQGTRGTCCGR